MGVYEILLYYYIAWILAGIGLSLLFNSLFFIKKKSGKVVFGIGFILLVPIGCFKVYEIRSDIERWNRLGPFFQAIDKNKYNKVKQLIEEGQNVNEENSQIYPSTPLLYAIDKKNIRVVRLLVENGADVNYETRNPLSTPLEDAIDKGDTAIVNYLLEHGANVSLRNDKNAQNPEDATVDLLLSKNMFETMVKHGSDFDGIKNNYEIVYYLLANKADFNTKLENESTFLKFEIAKRDTAILDYLLEHGAQVYPRDTVYTEYPIEYATVNLSASKEIVEALLKHGADADCNQGAPLKGAVSKNNYEVVRCLLEHGAKVEHYLPELENRAKRNFDFLKGRSTFPEDSIKTVRILELLEKYASNKESE